MGYLQYLLPLSLLAFAASLPYHDVTSTKSLSNAINTFTMRLHQELSKTNGNVFYSPLSITSALGMLYRGAKGQTAEEISSSLFFKENSLSENEVHQGFQRLLDTLGKNPEEYTLDVANSVLTQKDFKVLPDYKEDLEKLYHAAVKEVDFQRNGEQVTEEVNQWVREKTRNKIEKLLDKVDPSTLLLLLNAVYFNGTWQTEFDPKNTKPAVFYSHGQTSTPKKIPTMHLTAKLRYARIESTDLLEIPYKGQDVSMVVILPVERNGLRQVESDLHRYSDIQRSLSKLRSTKVDLALPKFKLEYNTQLSSVLQNLGVKAAFSRKADLSGISGGKGLTVSKVIHKAAVDVNEKGSEAAAVTGIEVVPMSLIDHSRVSFNVNHPFAFAIVDKKSNTVLFMGRITNL